MRKKKQSSKLLKLFNKSGTITTFESVCPDNLLDMLDPVASGSNAILPLPLVDTQDNVNNLLLDLTDPGNWPNLNSNIINNLVNAGPTQVVEFSFPKTNNRKFSVSLYKRILANGDTISRSWLIYSISKDAVYCFCCCLFPKNKASQALSSSGCKDWSHIAQILKSHENSPFYIESFKSWKILEVGLKKIRL